MLHSAEAPPEAVPGERASEAGQESHRPRRGPAADQWPEHPSSQVPRQLLGTVLGSAHGPQSAPFSISLSFLICRERRTDPDVLTQVAEPFSRYRIWMHPFRAGVLFLFLVGGPFALRLSQPAGSQPSLPRRNYLPD